MGLAYENRIKATDYEESFPAIPFPIGRDCALRSPLLSPNGPTTQLHYSDLSRDPT